MTSRKNITVSRKTVKALLKKEFGISDSGLVTERASDGVYIYRLMMGRFEITISNDWFTRNGLISLQVSSNSGESIWLFYDPFTLAEDFSAEEKNRAESKN